MSPPAEEQTAFVVCDHPLLTSTPDQLLTTVNKFDELVLAVERKAENGEGTYVISTEEIDSGSILLFIYFAFRIHRLGWKPKFGGTGDGLNELAKHIGHWTLSREERMGVDCSICDFLMRDISCRDQMVAEIEDWANHVKESTNASEEQVARWKGQIGEVTTNSFQHGQSSLMFLAGRSNSDSTVSLAVLDLGATIPATIRKHPDCPKSPDGGNDGDCIKFACRKGVTSKSVPENQGSGLHGLTETVKKTGGSMQILSGSGVFHLSGERRDCRNLPSIRPKKLILDGTLVTMNFQIQ